MKPAIERVAAIIVTRNRCSQLKTLLSTVKLQMGTEDAILVINNGSSDDTKGWLQQTNFVHSINQENLGSAGGFATGFSWGLEWGYDLFWCMDDDGTPANDCLLKLRKTMEPGLCIRNAIVCQPQAPHLLSFASSCPGSSVEMQTVGDILRCSGGRAVIPGILHPYNGTLITREVVEKVGKPVVGLFLWGDEKEYTLRCLKFGVDCGLCVDAFHFHPADRMQKFEARLGRWEGWVYDHPAPLQRYLINRNSCYLRRQYTGWKAAVVQLALNTTFNLRRSGVTIGWKAFLASLHGCLGYLGGHHRFLRTMNAESS